MDGKKFRIYEKSTYDMLLREQNLSLNEVLSFYGTVQASKNQSDSSAQKSGICCKTMNN